MPSSSSLRALSSVIACRNALGDRPAQRVKSFCSAFGVVADLLRQLVQGRLVAVVEADAFDDAAHEVVVLAGRRDVFLQYGCRCVHGCGLAAVCPCSPTIARADHARHPILAGWIELRPRLVLPDAYLDIEP